MVYWDFLPSCGEIRRVSHSHVSSIRTMLRLVFLIAVPLLLLKPAGADDSVLTRTLKPGKPTDVAVDAEKLDLAVSLIRHAVEDDEIPGAVVLVARRGQVILHEAFGHRDLKRKVPMQKNALFRMASNSKAVTSAGILVLVEDGILELDAPIGRYLTAFDTDDWKRVTLRHLLTHTSGSRIKPLFLTPLLKKSEIHPQAPDLRLEVDRFANIAPEKEPGTTYSYNNACYNILAALIEKQTGSYKEHLRSRIYEPLKMSDSCNHESDADNTRMSTVLKRQADGTWKEGWTPGDKPDWPFPRGSGGMVSSALDYAKFCQMLLNGGTYEEQKILSEETVKEMTSPQSKLIEAATGYGLGWSVKEAGGGFSHSGSDGTYVWVDPENEIIGMLLTQTNGATHPRKGFRELVLQSCTDRKIARDTALHTPARSADGFYKDIFMSSGKSLTSRKRLHAAESIGLEYEYYAGSDVTRQNHFLIGSAEDANGILLYPDGSPRFRMLYVNGGGATSHGKSLTKDGRNRLRGFYRSGGSYCGSCAGSFLSGRNVDKRSERRLGYLHIFPFNTLNTGIKKTRVGHQIPQDSPLLRYRDFGEDSSVLNVYHNNGNWLDTTADLPGIEVLARYSHPGHKIDGGAAIWAYQAKKTDGRIVNIGCHPEGSSEGELLALTEACFLHALSGTGRPRLKATLKLGDAREMSRSTSDDQPSFTKIGDRQYHHFAFDVPDSAGSITIEMTSKEKNVDLHLLLCKDSIAFRSNSSLFDLRSGANKKLSHQLSPGRWYLSVYCATTVQTINDPDSGFYRYVGDRSILNGAAYTIRVDQSEN